MPRSFSMERDPLSKSSRIRDYVLRDAEGGEVARFNEEDVVGIRKGRRVEVAVRSDWDW